MSAAGSPTASGGHPTAADSAKTAAVGRTGRTPRGAAFPSESASGHGARRLTRTARVYSAVAVPPYWRQGDRPTVALPLIRRGDRKRIQTRRQPDPGSARDGAGSRSYPKPTEDGHRTHAASTSLGGAGNHGTDIVKIRTRNACIRSAKHARCSSGETMDYYESRRPKSSPSVNLVAPHAKQITTASKQDPCNILRLILDQPKSAKKAIPQSRTASGPPDDVIGVCTIHLDKAELQPEVSPSSGHPQLPGRLADRRLDKSVRINQGATLRHSLADVPLSPEETTGHDAIHNSEGIKKEGIEGGRLPGLMTEAEELNQKWIEFKQQRKQQLAEAKKKAAKKRQRLKSEIRKLDEELFYKRTRENQTDTNSDDDEDDLSDSHPDVLSQDEVRNRLAEKKRDLFCVEEDISVARLKSEEANMLSEFVDVNLAGNEATVNHCKRDDDRVNQFQWDLLNKYLLENQPNQEADKVDRFSEETGKETKTINHSLGCDGRRAPGKDDRVTGQRSADGGFAATEVRRRPDPGRTDASRPEEGRANTTGANIRSTALKRLLAAQRARKLTGERNIWKYQRRVDTSWRQINRAMHKMDIKKTASGLSRSPD